MDKPARRGLLPDTTPTLLSQAFADCPGLETFCDSLWGNFSPKYALKHLRNRAAQLLEKMPPQQLQHELAEWQRLGIVPEPDPTNQDLVGVLWQSPLFQTLMDAIGFSPPDNIDIRKYMAPRYPSLTELVMARAQLQGRCQRGAVARGEIPYWQVVLQIQAPHLYLEPFLPQGVPLEGCDLACGWGRICLTLSEYRQRRIHACDLADSSLITLQKLAAIRELKGVIETHRVDILHLPFADNQLDFFLAFDIFEHMIDDMLRPCVLEMLRCGKVGCVLYAEIPMEAYCPALTHLQNWNQVSLCAFFENLEVDGKRWKMRQWSPFIPDHFTFVIE